MRESCTYGSGRGARGETRVLPLQDAILLHLLTAANGTTRTQADPVARPLSARADIRGQTATSGGDPLRKSGGPKCCDAQTALW